MATRRFSLRSLDATYIALAWLIVVVCTNQLGFGIIVPVVPAFARSFGVSQALAGLVISVYGLGRLLFDLPMGGLAERWGRRTVIVTGEIITAVGSLLCGVAGEFWQLILFRFIAGIGAATVLTGAQVLLADITTPQTRAKIMNTYQGAFLCAVGIGPAVGGVIADTLGTRAPFFAFAFLSLAASVIALTRIPETRGNRVRAADAPPPPRMGETLAVLLRTRGFLLIGAVTFVSFFARTGALFNVVPIIGKDRIGLSASVVGLAISVASLMNFFTIPISTVLMGQWGRKGAILPGALLSGAAFAVFAFAFHAPVFFLGTILWGFGGGIGGAAPATYAADMAPRGANGVTMGIYLTLADAGYVVGPFLLGIIADRAGASAALLFTAVLFVLVAVPFALFAPETLHGKRNRPVATAPVIPSALD